MTGHPGDRQYPPDGADPSPGRRPRGQGTRHGRDATRHGQAQQHSQAQQHGQGASGPGAQRTRPMSPSDRPDQPGRSDRPQYTSNHHLPPLGETPARRRGRSPRERSACPAS
ncbi:hypothetical protein [Tsukamurella soli]|uniref:hypothetical protein n=1 Tax=Tsukamurella soli TaxID=644556 RepID=UPI00362196F5